jgi:hypothetical protein
VTWRSGEPTPEVRGRRGKVVTDPLWVARCGPSLHEVDVAGRAYPGLAPRQRRPVAPNSPPSTTKVAYVESAATAAGVLVGVGEAVPEAFVGGLGDVHRFKLTLGQIAERTGLTEERPTASVAISLALPALFLLPVGAGFFCASQHVFVCFRSRIS